MKALAFKQDWLAKSSAGLFLGFLLGLGVSGLFVALAPDMLPSVKAQLAMWVITPIWLTVLTTVFLFRNGRRAWLWLGFANLLVFGLFFGLRLI